MGEPEKAMQTFKPPSRALRANAEIHRRNNTLIASTAPRVMSQRERDEHRARLAAHEQAVKLVTFFGYAKGMKERTEVLKEGDANEAAIKARRAFIHMQKQQTEAEDMTRHGMEKIAESRILEPQALALAPAPAPAPAIEAPPETLLLEGWLSDDDESEKPSPNLKGVSKRKGKKRASREKDEKRKKERAKAKAAKRKKKKKKKKKRPQPPHLEKRSVLDPEGRARTEAQKSRKKLKTKLMTVVLGP
jgi:hypothetical protein